MANVVISELATELNTDPLGLGYASLMSAGDHSGLADVLNDKTGLGAGTIDREVVDAATLQGQVVASEYTALSAVQQQLWLALLVASQGSVKVNDSGITGQVLQVWGAGTTTRGNMAALQTRQGSRAEVLWGDGAVVTHTAVAEALGG